MLKDTIREVVTQLLSALSPWSPEKKSSRWLGKKCCPPFWLPKNYAAAWDSFFGTSEHFELLTKGSNKELMHA
jgi:hypothetical protein